MNPALVYVGAALSALPAKPTTQELSPVSHRVSSQTAWLRLAGQSCLWGTTCRDSQPEALMAPPFALHLALVSREAS